MSEIESRTFGYLETHSPMTAKFVPIYRTESNHILYGYVAMSIDIKLELYTSIFTRNVAKSLAVKNY